MKRAEEMDQSHPNCTEGHVCQEPSGRTCLECDEPAGTFWGPYWCPEHDKERLDRISENLKKIVQMLGEKSA